jgi:hypothetical protein
MSRKVTQMKLLQEVKQGSSKWIKTMDDRYANFYWQDGYGIFSVSPKGVNTVIKYIKNQHAHHQKIDFKKEYRKFLEHYRVDYDERYVWD